MIKRHIAVYFLISSWCFGIAVEARDDGIPMTTINDQAPSLTMDKKLGNLKQAVVSLSRDLVHLEKELLFPGNTQISVFLSLPDEASIDLQSVQLELNDDVITHHIYSEREINALSRGGVHRVYMGNLSEGTHKLNASIIGTDSLGNDYKESTSLEFNKESPPKFIELTIVNVLQEQQPEFVIKEWQ